MTARTPEEAAQTLCPWARTFAAPKAEPNCQGPVCALWRFERITTSHPLWMDAVRSEAAKIGEKVPYPKAAKIVAENKVALGMVPTRGWCGAGGEP